jgi:hypothetical protein
MAVQRLLRFAACEYREVSDAIKQATVAAPSRSSVLVLHGMPSAWHAVRQRRWFGQRGASNGMLGIAW